jgi:hypothetical protein
MPGDVWTLGPRQRIAREIAERLCSDTHNPLNATLDFTHGDVGVPVVRR